MSDNYDEWRRDPLKWEACGRLETLGATIGPIEEEGVAIEILRHADDRPIQDGDIPGIVRDVNTLGNVRTLDLSESEITDRAMKYLGRLRSVQQLHMVSTGITDNGLKHLTTIPRLMGIGLSGTAVSDRAIVHLAQMKRLKFLQLFETKITEKGIAALTKALPALTIESDAGLVRPRVPTTHGALKSLLFTIDAGTATINSVAFTPDGKKLVSFGADNYMRIWNAKSAALIREIKCANAHHSMAPTPDGKFGLTFGQNTSMGLWDLASGKRRVDLKGGKEWIWISCAAFSPNGKLLASANQKGSIILWNIRAAKPIATVAENLRAVWQLKFSPDGALLGWVGTDPDRGVVLWNIATECAAPVPVKHKPWPISIAFSPDGKLLATACFDRINFWNIPENRLERTLHIKSETGGRVAFSPDKRIFAAARDRAIVFWDITTGKKLRTVAKAGEHDVCSLAFAPTQNGNVLASANSDGTIDLWNQ